MNKRVWSIAVALAMLCSMVCSVFVVSAADESVLESDALDATVQLNNYASEQPALLNTEGGSEPTSVVMSTEKEHLSLDEEFDISVSLENYRGDWAIFVAELTYDPAELEYKGFETKIGEEFTLSIDESNKASGSLMVFMMSNQGTNLPAVEGTAALMDLKFKAIAETDNAKLSFTFVDDSVAGYVGDEPEFIATEAYAATSDFEREVRVYQPHLTMRLVDESGNPVTEIEQGEKVKAIVCLNNFYEGWMMMTLDLQYNGNKFKYISSEDLGNLVDSETSDPVSMLVAETEDAAKPLSICFFSPSLGNMILKDGASDADILELTLEAQGAGSALEIGTSFQQEGNFKYDAATGEEELLTSADDYVEEHEEGTAEVKVTQKVFPYLSVVVEEDKPAFSRGEKFTLQVNITDYVDPWSMMSILVNLNKNVFEVDTDNIVALGDSDVAVVPVISGNKLGITIFSEEGDDLKLGASSGTILEIPITIKSDYTVDGSEFPITASFLAGGNLSGDDVAGYIETSAVKPITVRGKPELSIRIDQIDGVDVPEGEEIGAIEQGKEVRFAVSIKDFTSAWEVMTLKALFDSDVFEFVSVEDKNAFNDDGEGAHSEFITEHAKGTLLACWFNGDPLPMYLPNQDIMVFTLKVRQEDLTEEQLRRFVSVAFLEGGNYQNGAELDGDNYTDTPAEVEVKIETAASEISVKIEWGAMAFTYSFGTWDPQNHIWDGRGWTCLNADSEAENWITVTNQGKVDITATFEFAVNPEKTDLVGLTHTFEQDGTAVSSLTVDKAEGDAYNSATVQFELGDLPAGAELSTDTKTVLGTITVTIDKAV